MIAAFPFDVRINAINRPIAGRMCSPQINEILSVNVIFFFSSQHHGVTCQISVQVQSALGDYYDLR